MSTDDLNNLLARCALRDEKALEALYARSAPRLYALAVGVVRRREWAEEVLQDAFVKIWTHADRYRPEQSHSMTWMSTIVRNRALDKLREVGRNPLLQNDRLDDVADTPLVSGEMTPSDYTLLSHDTRALLDCLATLDADQKRAILMSYYHGYSHRELSSKLTAPLGTVKGWIRRGLERLRLCLDGR